MEDGVDMHSISFKWIFKLIFVNINMFKFRVREVVVKILVLILSERKNLEERKNDV